MGIISEAYNRQGNQNVKSPITITKEDIREYLVFIDPKSASPKSASAPRGEPVNTELSDPGSFEFAASPLNLPETRKRERSPKSSSSPKVQLPIPKDSPSPSPPRKQQKLQGESNLSPTELFGRRSRGRPRKFL